jgi:hypothetical protein
MTIRTNTRIRGLARTLPAMAALLAIAACGATDEPAAAGANDAPSTTDADADTDEVASISTVADSSSDSGSATDDSSGDGTPDPHDMQEATLEYARCMREHGVDMPDPVFSAEGGSTGGVMIQAGGPGEEIDPTEMDEANGACQSILDDVRGEFEAPDPEELEKMKADALEFSKCMREHGIDMPDPVFGDNGEMTVRVGDDGSGSAPAPIPFDNDEFEEASEACGRNGGFFSVNASGPTEGEGPTNQVVIGNGVQVDGDGDSGDDGSGG